MQETAVERFFRMVCAAFPIGGAALTRSGKLFLRRGKIPPQALVNSLSAMRRDVATISENGEKLYLIYFPLPPFYQLILSLRAQDYAEAEIPLRMLDGLCAAASSANVALDAQSVSYTENQLLDSLLYADTLEMKIYASLLAGKNDKSLEVNRVVCIVECERMRQDDVIDAIRSFKASSLQDICGVTKEGQVILCRCVDCAKYSIKAQLDGYLPELLERIDERCGISPIICCGTCATQPEEYRLSFEAALVALECADRRRGSLFYISEYIPEYILYKGDGARLRHFLEPYAKRLSLEPELLATANALLENNMNVLLTAEKTYMHRNTITRRIAKLKSLLSIDSLSSDRNKFLLMLICKYLKYSQHK